MKLLLLAGSEDAARLSLALAREPRLSVIASLPNPVASPVSLGVPTRIGSWGGDTAFADWLKRENVGAILDASHPYSNKMSERAVRVSDGMGLDYLQFLRRQWIPRSGDSWIFLNDMAEVEKTVAPTARVLIDIDDRSADGIGPLNGRTVFLRFRRQLPGSGMPGHWQSIHVSGLPTVAAEERKFEELGIDWIVALNRGGPSVSAKLEAARRLGIPVAMLRRPRQPEAPRTDTVAGVLNWVRRRL